MKNLYEIHNFKNLSEKLTGYKNPTNSSGVNLIIINNPRSFQNFCTFETGLSNFHKMTLTLLKSTSTEQKLRVLNYLNYKFFNNALFRDHVLNKLRNSNLQISNKDLKHFKERFPTAVSTIAPLRSRVIRANQAPLINKEIQRAVIVR